MSKHSRNERATLEVGAVSKIDSWEPDEQGVCICCGQSPTVQGISNGKVVYSSGMCGPCTWGDSDAVDPANW